MIDYHNFSDINSTKEWRKKFNIGDIYSNAIVCKKCGWFIRSRNRHDFVTCKCGTCSIDGGSNYVRIVGNLEDIEIRTVYFKDVKEENV